jgi:hypothetical protein
MTQVVELPDYKEIRRLKILEYAKRQKQRSVIDTENDCQDITECQQEWVEARINIRKPASSWERWDGMIDEWTPWNRFGEPINQWRYYKK